MPKMDLVLVKLKALLLPNPYLYHYIIVLHRKRRIIFPFRKEMKLDRGHLRSFKKIPNVHINKHEFYFYDLIETYA